MVAGEVPLPSASSTIVERAALAGSVSTSSATRCSAPVNSGSPARTRASTLSVLPFGESPGREASTTARAAVSSSRAAIVVPFQQGSFTVSGKSSY